MAKHGKHIHEYKTLSHTWQYDDAKDMDVRIKVEECDHCGDVRVTVTETRKHKRG